MAIQADLLFVGDISAREENGALVELRRLYRVTALAPTGPQILLDALNIAGVPVAGERATESTTGPLTPIDGRGGNLVVTQRIAKAIDVDKVEIEILYEISGGLSTDITNLRTGGAIAGTAITGISELSVTTRSITTKFDKPLNDPSRDLISVVHTFPTDDPTIKNPGATVKQGGEIQVFAQSITARINGFGGKDDPLELPKRFVLKVNKKPWARGEKRTWLCTNVSPRILDRTTSPQRWYFEFEFEYREETWDPVAVFIDPATGKPPVGLEPTTFNPDGSVNVRGGFQQVKYYSEADFNVIFPSTADDGQAAIKYI